MTMPIIICINCKHYQGQANGVYSCGAFKEIPDDVLFGEFDHTKKHPDQNNDIVFESVLDGDE